VGGGDRLTNHACFDECYQCMDGWMGGWMDGWMDGY